MDNRIDLQPFGRYEILFLMDNPEGLQGGEGNVVLSFLPCKMLSFTWNAPPDFPLIRNHEHKTWVVVEFEETPDNTTTLTLSHLGWLKGDEWDQVFNYFDQAWSRVMMSLEESCQ